MFDFKFKLVKKEYPKIHFVQPPFFLFLSSSSFFRDAFSHIQSTAKYIFLWAL